MTGAVHVKISGVATPDDALLCIEAGASAIGIPFDDGRRRHADVEIGRRIVDAVAGRALVVAVVRDRSVTEMRELLARTGCGCLELRGEERPEVLAPLLPHAYKVIEVGGCEDLARASAYGGDYLAVDVGRRAFDLALLASLARTRKLALAGDLRPDDVAAAIRAVRPHTVDVDAGVERADGKGKDVVRMRAFVDAVKAAG